jgi:hypothetical protein
MKSLSLLGFRENFLWESTIESQRRKALHQSETDQIIRTIQLSIFNPNMEYQEEEEVLIVRILDTVTM